ncbi:hypothetical protein RDI58_023363 [Solanum bulbocastanum]|uniref:Uncharacterized protein n=1 Tax=Solanum bulbocastanum TaxID=147425 RepID=A0AAN8Y6J7_SOLBU
MSKQTVVTPQKSPRLVEETSTDEVHASSFNILTQTLPQKIVETPARGGFLSFERSKGEKTRSKEKG